MAGDGLTELSLRLCPRAAWQRSLRGQRLRAEELEEGQEKGRRSDRRAEELDAGIRQRMEQNGRAVKESEGQGRRRERRQEGIARKEK